MDKNRKNFDDSSSDEEYGNDDQGSGVEDAKGSFDRREEEEVVDQKQFAEYSPEGSGRVQRADTEIEGT
jgi:hypothetical protein